jgi:hypothetical protein
MPVPVNSKRKKVTKIPLLKFDVEEEELLKMNNRGK